MKIVSFFERIENPVDTSETIDTPSLLIETKCYTPSELLALAIQGMDVPVSVREDFDDGDFVESDDPLMDIHNQREIVASMRDEVDEKLAAKAQKQAVDEPSDPQPIEPSPDVAPS